MVPPKRWCWCETVGNIPFFQAIPNPTPRKTNMSPEKSMVGRYISYWNSPFFRGHVSFQGCSWWFFTNPIWNICASQIGNHFSQDENKKSIWVATTEKLRCFEVFWCFPMVSFGEVVFPSYQTDQGKCGPWMDFPTKTQGEQAEITMQ